MGLFHHVLVYKGDLHLVLPTLNLSILRHFDNDATSKFDDVLTEHGGLPHVLPIAVYLGLFKCGEVKGTILRCSYSLSLYVGLLLHA